MIARHDAPAAPPRDALLKDRRGDVWAGLGERDEWVWAASDHNPYHMSVYANQIASPKQLDPPTGSPKGDAATLLPAPAIALPKQPPHAPGPRPQS